MSFLVSKATNPCYEYVFSALINVGALFEVRISNKALLHTSPLLIMASLF